MENNIYLVFLLISVLALPLVTATPTMSPPVPPEMSVEQLHNIIEALIGANDFRSWADVLSVSDPSTFPMTATFFIPTDDANERFSSSLTRDFDPSIILYHIVPQEFTFSDLQKLPIGSRLTTLLQDKSILVTNNAGSNFTIDDCLITHPDVIINGAFSVHGIGSILNYTTYAAEPLHQSPVSSDIPGGFSPPTGESVGRRHSDAPCSCAQFPIILSVFCAIFAFKIH
ncbi:fasciclin-like arabinogalactan protein 7 [Telopea speciosissima]|uniref:fasciclin-like arabinogalactan protein 7 n=1 Tax=Telopea speciosissima TaxID=54955 RepID=UPI001CC56489|nr:fasciclin-like arabinogalactan protein 7 [Telopea speciosissima]